MRKELLEQLKKIAEAPKLYRPPPADKRDDYVYKASGSGQGYWEYSPRPKTQPKATEPDVSSLPQSTNQMLQGSSIPPVSKGQKLLERVQREGISSTMQLSDEAEAGGWAAGNDYDTYRDLTGDEKRAVDAAIAANRKKSKGYSYVSPAEVKPVTPVMKPPAAPGVKNYPTLPTSTSITNDIIGAAKKPTQHPAVRPYIPATGNDVPAYMQPSRSSWNWLKFWEPNNPFYDVDDPVEKIKNWFKRKDWDYGVGV